MTNHRLALTVVLLLVSIGCFSTNLLDSFSSPNPVQLAFQAAFFLIGVYAGVYALVREYRWRAAESAALENLRARLLGFNMDAQEELEEEIEETEDANSNVH